MRKRKEEEKIAKKSKKVERFSKKQKNERQNRPGKKNENYNKGRWKSAEREKRTTKKIQIIRSGVGDEKTSEWERESKQKNKSKNNKTDLGEEIMERMKVSIRTKGQTMK